MRAGTLISPYSPHKTFPISSRPTYCALCRCQPSQRRPPYPRPGGEKGSFCHGFQASSGRFPACFLVRGRVLWFSPVVPTNPPSQVDFSREKPWASLGLRRRGGTPTTSGGLLTGQAHRCRPMRTRLPLRSLALGVCSIRFRASTADRLGCAVCVFSALIVSRFQNFFNAFVPLSF